MVVPTLFCTRGALLFSRFYGAKAILHIQGFELDAMLQLGMGKNRVFSKLGFVLESWLMCRFDSVSAISNSMVKKAKQKFDGRDRVFYFPNWADVDFVKPGVNDKVFRE